MKLETRKIAEKKNTLSLRVTDAQREKIDLFFEKHPELKRGSNLALFAIRGLEETMKEMEQR